MTYVGACCQQFGDVHNHRFRGTTGSGSTGFLEHAKRFFLCCIFRADYQGATDMDEKALVLVVDDDHGARLIMKKALAQSGLTVMEAENGQQALNVFEKHQPDLVLLDVKMPEMDGFEACRRIRANPKSTTVPVMVITSKDDSNDIRKAYDAGATDFMPKPINSLILRERVSYMLRASDTACKLYQSQELLAKAQALACLGSFSYDPHGQGIHFLSETFRTIFNLPDRSDTVTWAALWQTIHSGDRTILKHKLQRLQTEGIRFRQDIRLVGSDQGHRHAMLQMDSEVDSSGKVVRIIGFVQDITDRKLSELLEKDKNQVMQQIARKEPLAKIFREITEILERQRPHGFSAICQVEKGRIQKMLSASLPPEFCQSMAGLTLSEKNGSCAATAHLGRPVVAENTGTSTFWEKIREAALVHQVASSASVPIISATGQVLGTIALMHRYNYKATPEDLELMESLANLAALAAEQSQLSEQLYYQARHDHLTGLSNRATLKDQLSQTLKQSVRSKTLGAYLLIDLDNFKFVNDTYGHHTGDRLLQEVAKRLQHCVREGDVLSRMGGDEFVVVLPNLKHKEDAVRAASRMLESLNSPFIVGSYKGIVEASIGISLFSQDGMDGDTLHKNADIAMYTAKNQGGNRFQFFDSKMHEAVVERLQIENELRKALERNEFELHYQPQLNMTSKELLSMEALIRWNHPEHGQIAPCRFIPVAEESRLIIPIGRWVLREACRQNREWQEKGFPPVRVAVNVSAVQFMETDFVDSIREALEETGLDPRWLELEVTETAIVKDLEKACTDLQNIKNLGVTTILDDFGAGHSSITYLDQMPLDGLKVDRHFVEGMNVVGTSHKSRSSYFIKAFSGLARDLQLNLVAEGIETEHQKEALKALDYTIGQGFLFSVPLSAMDASVFLDAYKSQDDETGTISVIPKALKHFLNEEACDIAEKYIDGEFQTPDQSSMGKNSEDEAGFKDKIPDSVIMTKRRQKGCHMTGKISENIIYCPNCGGKSFTAGTFIFGSDSPQFEIKEFASEVLERQYQVKGAKQGVWNYVCDNCGAKMTFRMRITSKEQLMFDSSYETAG